MDMENMRGIANSVLPLLSGFGNYPQRTFKNVVGAQQKGQNQRTAREKKDYEDRLRKLGAAISNMSRSDAAGGSIERLAIEHDIRLPDAMQMAKNYSEFEAGEQARMGRIKAEGHKIDDNIMKIVRGNLPGNLEGIRNNLNKLYDAKSKLIGSVGESNVIHVKGYGELVAEIEENESAEKLETKSIWEGISTRKPLIDAILVRDGKQYKVKKTAEEIAASKGTITEGIPKGWNKKGETGSDLGKQLRAVKKEMARVSKSGNDIADPVDISIAYKMAKGDPDAIRALNDRGNVKLTPEEQDYIKSLVAEHKRLTALMGGLSPQENVFTQGMGDIMKRYNLGAQ